MALIKPEDVLAFNVKIPRKLHDKIDDLRAKAKEKGVIYDPSPAIIKALEKDITASEKELKGLKVAVGERPAD